MNPKSELAWRLADFQRASLDAPDRLIADPTACEGELMTRSEVDQHIADSIGVLLVMLDEASPRFGPVRAAFLADLDFLLGLGKITPDEYNDITSSEEMMI